MEEVLSQLKTLSHEELRGQILAAGLKCGPITNTTRAIFEKKLARALLESQGTEKRENDVSSKTKGISDEGVRAHLEDGSPQEKKGSLSSVDGQEQRSFSSSQGLSSPLREDEGAVDGQLLPSNSPTHYYVVCSPSTLSGKVDTPAVYSDRKKALSAVMKVEGARFKVFSSREDADMFMRAVKEGSTLLMSPSSKSPVMPNIAENRGTNVEKPNEFKSPRTQDLTAKLRKAVENGDEKSFHKLVWGNPRYLIGSADNPTIVQEGCRYNVLHVAAKENQPRMVQLVLETLENPDFLRLMYPDDQESMLWQRMAYIVDLYLNMPDKTNNETPLHFACKFGCPEVVDILCSHPATDKQRRNKYNQKPASVICDRKNKTKEMKKKIAELLEDRFYVPLLRVSDNTLQPVIAGPWSPGAEHWTDGSLAYGTAMTTIDPAMRVTAYAGPLTFSKAIEFHKLWKTPPRLRAKYFHNILKSDPERGVERVGRELAREHGLPWAEYWQFLDGFVDLTVEQGLDALEAYLKYRTSRPAQLGPREKEADSRECAVTSSNEDGLCKTDAALQVNTREKGENFSEISRMPTSEKSLASSSSAFVCNLMHKFDSITPPEASKEDQGEKKGPRLPDKQELNLSDSGIEGLDQSEPGVAWLDQPDANAGGLDLSDPGFWGRWVKKTQKAGFEKDKSSGSSDEYLTADEDTASGQGDVYGAPLWPYGRARHYSSSTTSSYKSLQSAGLADSSDQSLFVEGDSPTRLDNDLLVVVEQINIDPHKYPAIARWKSTVVAYPSEERRRWPHTPSLKPSSHLLSSTPRDKTSPRLSSPAWLCRPRRDHFDSSASSFPICLPGEGLIPGSLSSRSQRFGSASV